MSKYRTRVVKTASGAKAVQVVWYHKGITKVAKHLGSAKNSEHLELLLSQAEQYIADNNHQLSFIDDRPRQIVAFDDIEVAKISHDFARECLLLIADKCGLGSLDILYRDLAIMRIIEPCSKLRSIKLLQQYFGISYTRYLYECLPKLLEEKSFIETAAAETAKNFQNAFALVLYDVTTLYFETHKPDDELQVRGFSKDDKSKQPQIVIGLLVTASGFPLVQEVFKGNTFEGHTMLAILKAFKQRYQTGNPIVVADAAMLSQENQRALNADGYQYIVGARLANASPSFISDLCSRIEKHDGATLRITYATHDISYDVICSYSHKRYKKAKLELDKQIKRANILIGRKEPGKRAKFIKKSLSSEEPYVFDELLKQKAEQLLGIKGYCTNIPASVLSDNEIIAHYHNLWHVEQDFRVSKSDLKARPIFHYTHDAIRAHVLVCFMALMISKYIEIKAGLSIRYVRDLFWQVYDVILHDPLSKKSRNLRTSVTPELEKILNVLEIKNTY